MTHTQGPWRVIGDSSGLYVAAGAAPDYHARPIVVFTVQAGEDRDRARARQVADLHLIAAADKMLEALHVIADDLDRWAESWGGVQSAWSSTFAAAREGVLGAIAAAEGEAVPK